MVNDIIHVYCRCNVLILQQLLCFVISISLIKVREAGYLINIRIEHSEISNHTRPL